MGLTVDPLKPLVSMITRLVERKGIGLLVRFLGEVGPNNTQFVILGKGDPRFEEKLLQIATKYPGQVSVQVRFDEALAHLIYAASDIFLVPSVFEPCGLTQMVAMRYGAVPVVSRVGGLSDTVDDGLTGFTFSPVEFDPFKQALNLALDAFIKGKLTPIMANGLTKDYSWDKSAQKYIKLYEKALNYKFGIARGVGGEIRSNALGEWTILSTLRKSRPDETGSLAGQRARSEEQRVRTHSSLEEVENCPFEEGHEAMSPGEIFRTGKGDKDQPGWLTRVVPNKYPILPAHEVIVHSTEHDKEIELFTKEQMDNLVWTYLSRYRHYEILVIPIFLQSWKRGGRLLNHPHSQLIVLDEMAHSTVEALKSAGDYYGRYKLCPYCDLIQRKLMDPDSFGKTTLL